MFFASLLAMIVAGVIVFGVIIGLIINAVSKSTSEPKVQVAANSVLVIDMNKRIHEQGESNSLAVLNDDDAYVAGIYDITRAIDHAKTDNNIKGILIKLSGTPNGWATLQQLRSAVKNFKGSGKFVYAYGEGITQGAYYVGSAADSIYLNPVGDLELKGFATVLAFFKGTLDKLELQPEIFYAGKFKSATEPFRAEKISDPNRLQIAEFQHDFWAEFLTAAAEHTHMDTASVHQLAASGAIEFPEDALSHKLVDGLMYWDQVEDRLKAKTGTSGKEKIKYQDLNEYARSIKGGIKGDNRVAVLFAEGNIADGESDDNHMIASETICDDIRKLRDNDKVKAVVLRVNSPGGSALASEVILRELQLLKAKKPLVVSMGDYAASGGYYISCQADSIFALPNTITGSIGVFSMMFNSENLLKNKLGVTFDEVKNAPYADFPTGVRALTPDETARMQKSVDNIYSIFKSRVVKGRKLDAAMVDSIAQGRVWTGTDALGNGLVDGIGDLNRAIESASRLAKLRTYDVVTYPEPSDKFEMMLKRFKGNSGASMIMKTMLEKEMGADYEYYKKIKELRTMNGKNMMLMPFTMSVQ